MTEKETKGVVLSAKKQWWLKVNTKAMRSGALDGATFPHIVKILYTVDGKEYIGRKWLNARVRCPAVGESVTVSYREDKPSKFSISIGKAL
ncbi:MAG: sugar ABC transporter permease [Clostridia bacterium]|nr:sugar ABC transporter permease [Clostridia bacterium]